MVIMSDNDNYYQLKRSVSIQFPQTLRAPIREWNKLRSSGVAFPTLLRFTGRVLGIAGTVLSTSRASTTSFTLSS
ncbi:hypothetical protein AH865_24190 [Salmonella enterica subsp. enterica serovar Infantis]|nr:hypothetical protein [Salmonella enterica subsp. enterica serovar Infantis]EGI5078407.1 hypothetical protein [Salmonella enterica subsp. enterica serovar Infantis]